MADVEMTDAPTSAATAATAVTKKKGADVEGKEGKKRFEVKKVYKTLAGVARPALTNLVECRRTLGMGHCRRQLRHLQEPHHGSL